MVQKQALDETGVDFAVLYCLYGAQVVRNDGWAAALCSAVNDWIAEEWLSKDRRFRGSIMVPWQNVQMAVAEIERLASDRRFVQVMLLARSEILLGRAAFWPIYEAAERHGLPIAIHAGGGMGNPNMASGWNRFFAEDHLSMQQAFQAQLVSLIAEGVFSKYPGLKVVFAESGFTWLPALMWRFDKNWRGLRREVPWIDRLPSDYIREHFRFTLQPVDESPDTRQMLQVIDQLGSDELLMFSTDYPHWQYDDEGPFPLELSEDVTRKVLRSNAESIYRLG
jgi:predicted TIM-barrel fold metal-dependent hydrolase